MNGGGRSHEYKFGRVIYIHSLDMGLYYMKSLSHDGSSQTEARRHHWVDTTYSRHNSGRQTSSAVLS